MPLFHIGGISASIICTLTSGGAVSCDPDPFDPSRMVEALALSNPQPTWYSSVPTIHNATVGFLKNIASSNEEYNKLGVGTDGIWANGHSLRMIRSGAAALLGPDGEALAAAFGGVPVYSTYSMSEQMPISQPPAGGDDSFFSKPGTVGVPVAASTAIVSKGNLRPQPPGVEGEIAISGPTVLKNYLANPEADQKSFFYLSIPESKSQRYFLTGDIGVIDSDGFLSLKGRAKELIKKGGEQVSPFEIEEPLKSHPWIETSICFAVPSKLYGEEVGCALVLSSSCPFVRYRPAKKNRSLNSSLHASLNSLQSSLHKTLHLSSSQHTHEEDDELRFSLHRLRSPDTAGTKGQTHKEKHWSSLISSPHKTLHLSSSHHTNEEDDELRFSLHRLRRRLSSSRHGHGNEVDQTATLKKVSTEMRAFLKEAKLAPVSDRLHVFTHLFPFLLIQTQTRLIFLASNLST